MREAERKEDILRLEKKIDEILNYTIKSDYYDLRQNKDTKSKKI